MIDERCNKQAPEQQCVEVEDEVLVWHHRLNQNDEQRLICAVCAEDLLHSLHGESPERVAAWQ